MSGEIVIDAPALSGSTLFALLFNDTGLVWDSVDEQDEVFTDAQIGQYDIALAEQGTASGLFAGDMPANVPASMRWYSVRRQAGGSPAVTDPAVGGSEVRAWTGTAWLDLNTLGGATAEAVREEIDANSTQLAAIIVDTEDLQNRVPAALTGAGHMPSDLLALNGVVASAAKLERSASTIVTGTVDTGTFSPTATEFEADDITEATADHYNGRVILFTSGALLGQATDIMDYALAGSNGHFTVTSLTEPPGNDATFVIV
jgi:hypothetical protein